MTAAKCRRLARRAGRCDRAARHIVSGWHAVGHPRDCQVPTGSE